MRNASLSPGEAKHRKEVNKSIMEWLSISWLYGRGLKNTLGLVNLLDYVRQSRDINLNK